MQTYTAVLLGATGLTGNLLLHALLNDADFSKVTILVRRPLGILHVKLVEQVVDFSNLEDLRLKLGSGDFIFSCIGTTNKKVKGNKAAYRNIDVDIPVNIAKIGNGDFSKFLLLSSAGASNSRNFYLQIKMEAEQAIAALKYPAFQVFRPGMLYGNRNEFRLSEKIGKVLMKLVDHLLPGRFKKYHGIQAADVATAMIAASKLPVTGMHIYHYTSMQQLNKG